MPIDAAKAQHLLTQIPSSLANPPKKEPPMTTHFISVQRRETAGQGRWREIASWTFTTTETDMLGPLNCGLRDNYRIIITEPSNALSQPSARPIQDQAPQSPDDPHREYNAGEQSRRATVS